MARDVKTGDVKTRIIPVTGYYNERNIDSIIKYRHEEFLPEFIRPNGEKTALNEIEILSISNVTGLYDPRKPKKAEEIFESLDYATYSRLKNSEREMNKLIDWYLGLREDYPYDGMAVRVIPMNEKLKSGNTGQQIYILRDYVLNNYKKFGPIIQKNVNNIKENSESKVKKLLMEKYDANNFRDVTNQMKRVYSALEKKFNDNKLPELTPEQKNSLLQYIQMKHYIEDDRVEIQLMNKDMLFHYTGKYVGHTSAYIDGRDSYREEYLDYPSKSPARKNEKKRMERTIKNKNRKTIKHYQTDEHTDSEPITKRNEPSVIFLAKLMENRYKNALAWPEY
jgi:hypothetical protein